MRYTCFLFLFCIHIFPLHAQTESHTTFQGIVSGEDGLPLRGVTIVTTPSSQKTLTDQSGHFTVELLPGAYTFYFSLIGYERKEVDVHIQGLLFLSII